MTPRYSFAARFALGALMAAMLAASGCRKAADTASVAAPANPDEKRYPLKGEIVRADLERKVLLVTHEEIPGYMPSMTMEFKASPGDLANAKPGQRIRAEMVEHRGEFSLEKIWPDDSVTVRALDAGAKALAQDSAVRGKELYREVGEQAPDFTLLDQAGRTVSASRFRGKKVMMNFIFTRCPVATMCPASTMKMSALQQAAKQAGVTDVEFVSVSLDPDYDTPGVLKDYADARGLDLSNWSFLTGPDAAVRHLLAQLGILREFEGGTIKHNLATLLIDANGRIIHRVDGSQWGTDDFLPKMR
ncbi:SCO family protein [Oleiharenicola sp. Vm1]|uniref:SCO family protein n=1 Tax=Oleiharenicola sp. Vm1 TaxID=3398393 RepID=UPI0039F51ECE